MTLNMFRLARQKLQIIWGIILSVSINMMDNLTILKRSAKHILHSPMGTFASLAILRNVPISATELRTARLLALPFEASVTVKSLPVHKAHFVREGFAFAARSFAELARIGSVSWDSIIVHADSMALREVSIKTLFLLSFPI